MLTYFKNAVTINVLKKIFTALLKRLTVPQNGGRVSIHLDPENTFSIPGFKNYFFVLKMKKAQKNYSYIVITNLIAKILIYLELRPR